MTAPALADDEPRADRLALADDLFDHAPLRTAEPAASDYAAPANGLPAVFHDLELLRAGDEGVGVDQ